MKRSKMDAIGDALADNFNAQAEALQLFEHGYRKLAAALAEGAPSRMSRDVSEALNLMADGAARQRQSCVDLAAAYAGDFIEVPRPPMRVTTGGRAS